MTLQALALAVLTFLLISCVGVIGYSVLAYRGVVTVKGEVDRSFSNLDGLLQERFEAFGELMQICRGHVPRDSSEMRDVALIRGAWAIASNKEEKLKSAADSDRALKNLIAAAQAHPVLQSAEYFSTLEKRMASLDKQIAEHREKYNSAISRFNTRLQQVPVRWMSSITGFTHQPYFAPPAGARISSFAGREKSPNA
jgi:LemA protein